MLSTAQNYAQPAPSRPRKVLAVASGKGGVGKTWFAITLAHALANQGQKTLLFDGDFGLGNVDVQLGLAPERDLTGVLSGELTLNQAALAYPEGNFDIIPGRSGSRALAEMPVNRLQQIGSDLQLLGAAYHRVVMDLGAGISQSTCHMTRHADTCLVVATDEPTSLTDAYGFMRTCAQQQPDLDVRVVINMADTQREGERTWNNLKRACENFLKTSPVLAGVVRWDQEVRACIKSSRPILTTMPDSVAAHDVTAIARRLADAV